MYSLEFNGYTLENTVNTTISGLTGLDRVPLRISEDPLTGGEGGNIWDRKFDMRTIVVEGDIYADDFATYYDIRKEIIAAFSKTAATETLVITRSDGQTLSINAKVVAIPLYVEAPGDFAHCTYQIILKCSDPFFFDSTLQTASAGLVTTSGYPVSTEVPHPVGGGSENTLSLVNSGDIDVYPTIQIEGPVTTPTVLNLTTNKQFKFNDTLTASDVVLIYQDNTGFFVTKNGVNAFANFEGTFFQIIQGTNVMRFGGASSDPSALLTVSFYNKYLTI